MSGTRLAVAGILVRERRLLMSRRPDGGAWPGLWELPGGKVEDGETPEEALVREWREELDATPLGPMPYDFGTESGVVPGGSRRHVTLLFFRVRGVRGTPRAKGVDALRWCPADEARLLATPPIDALVLARLAAEGGAAFRDTGDAEGRALAREAAEDDPFIEGSEALEARGVVPFAPEDGLCVAGPCEGESLDPLRISRRGAGWALDGGGMR